MMADRQQDEGGDRTARPIDRWKGIDLSILWQVCGGGALGGLLYSLMGGAVPGWSGFWTHLVSLFGGACAAGIGVFVLANSETSNRLRLIFFSLICGLSYPVVLEAAKKVAPTQTEEQVERARATVREAPTAGATDLVEIMNSNPAAESDPSISRDVAATAELAIEKLSQEVKDPSKSQSSASVDALREIGVAAAGSGYVGAAQEAIKQLSQISAPEADAAKQEVEKALIGGTEAAPEAGPANTTAGG